MSDCQSDDDSYVILDSGNMMSEERIRTEKSLKTIFQWIALFRYDDAKKAVNQAFDSTPKQSGSSNYGVFSPLKVLILDLINVERDYVYSEFKKLKSPFGLGKIESITQIRTNITNIATRNYPANNVERLRTHIQNIIRDTASKSTCDASTVVRIVATDLELYVNARFTKLQEQIVVNHYQNESEKTQFYKDSLVKITEVKTIIRNIKSEVLLPLKDLLIYETSAIEHLFSAYLALSQWDFVDSLLHLQTFSQTYREFIDNFSEKERDLTGRKITKGDEFPELYKWFYKVYEILLSKYTLYFSKTLFSEGKKIPKGSTTTVVDYAARLAEFYKKTKALSISLILNTQNLEKPFIGHGYKIRSRDISDTTCDTLDHHVRELSCYRDKFEVIFHHSREDQLNDTDKTELVHMYANAVDRKAKPYCYNDRLNKSYFVLLIDLNMFVAVVYPGKKQENDGEVRRFLDEFNHSMKLAKV